MNIFRPLTSQTLLPKMKLFKIITVITLVLGSIVSCDTSDDPGDIQNTINDCDFEVIVDKNEYSFLDADDFELSKLAIADNCFSFKLTASGCDGSSWDVRLIDADSLRNTNPTQRNLKVDFSNEEECTSIVSKTYSVDIEKLQIKGDSVHLNIINADKEISYDY